MLNITKHKEVKTYSHKGVNVCVEIDYDLGTISLLDTATKQPKKWLFTGREVNFMPGWLNILEAMKLAIEQAEGDLLKHQALKKKALDRKEIELHRAIADMEKNDPYAPHKQPDRNAPYQNINKKKR